MSILRLPWRFPLSAVLVAAGGAVGVLVLAVERLGGSEVYLTDPVATGAAAAAALVAEVARTRLVDAGARRAARLASGLVASLLLSLAVAALAVAAAAAGWPLASAAVAAWSIAWIPALVLAQLTASAAVRSEGAPAPGHAVVIAGTALAAVAALLLWRPTDPFAGVATIVPESWPARLAVVGDVATAVGLASLLVLPLALARAAAGSTDAARARLGVAATGASAAPLVVVFCVLLAVARNPGDIDPTAGSVAFFVAVAGGATASALCAVLATRRRVEGRDVRVAVRGVALALAALATGAVGTVVVAGGGSPALSALVVAALAVASAALAWWGGGRLAGELDASAVPTEPARARGGLTAREVEVLTLLAEGASNSGIAAQLVISERTVDAHLRAIFTKLSLHPDPGANRRVLAARRWLEEADPTG